MRIVHLADLHLGRSLAEFDLIDLQKELLEQILTYIAAQNVDAVVIAGDVYDRSLPPVQAVNLLSGFLCALARRHVPALIIAGNHDSPDRLAFMSGVLEESGIHIVGDDLLPKGLLAQTVPILQNAQIVLMLLEKIQILLGLLAKTLKLILHIGLWRDERGLVGLQTPLADTNLAGIILQFGHQTIVHPRGAESLQRT